MRRMLAIVLLIVLVATIPAQAAAGQVTVPESAQSAALRAAKYIHSTSVASGADFSFHAAVSDVDSDGASAVATALYLALRESGAVSFDELSYAADGSGLLVDDRHDFRFTNLAPGALHIAFKTSGDSLICNVSVDSAAAKTESAKKSGYQIRDNIVAIPLGSDPALCSNVTLAANSIYDTTLADGDVFSFIASVGPTSGEYGYQPAIDGRGEIVSGGGVNIVASALWLLIQQRTDFVIVEKSTYGSRYNQTYVENSIDAIATDYASAADFSFRYTGSGSVTLYAAVEEGVLYVGIV